MNGLRTNAKDKKQSKTVKLELEVFILANGT